MALNTILVHSLCSRLKPGTRIASMGYPDIIAPRKELEKILGSRIYSLKENKNSEEIGKWHGVRQEIPDAHSFFELQGATLDVFDTVKHRGCEIVADLNFPITQAEEYDFVLDIGTMEHCFNIGQAAMNMAGLLKSGGIILHENPFNWGNHGFYNINPTWYVDFYGQTGFDLLDLQMIVRNCKMDGTNVGNISKTKRFAYMQSEANMVAIARRTVVQEIIFPVQSKYANKISSLQKVIPAAEVSGERDANERAIGAVNV